MVESPFNAIYIIDAKTGLALISRNFTTHAYDEDLISGMFKALESFITHLCYSSQYERLEEINFNGTRIVFERKAGLMAVGISRKNNCDEEHKVLGYLLDAFIQENGKYLEDFKGNVAPFQHFQQTFNRIPMEQISSLKDLAFYQKMMYSPPSLNEGLMESTYEMSKNIHFREFLI